MNTVGLSRGAADCSETNFTIISFGGGEWLRLFVYQPSEDDSEEALQSERWSCDKANKFRLLHIFLYKRTKQMIVGKWFYCNIRL